MGLIYGVCVLASSVAAFELGKAAVQEHSIEETAKSFFYGACALGWVPGGAFTGVAVCALHAWDLGRESKKYYILSVIAWIGNLFSGLYDLGKGVPQDTWNHLNSTSTQKELSPATLDPNNLFRI